MRCNNHFSYFQPEYDETSNLGGINCQTCAGCGSDLGGVSGYHFHHNDPATPGSDEYELWESSKIQRERLRVFGPEDLLDMAHMRGKSDLDMTSLNERIQRLCVGDRVKLCFLVQDKKADWLPKEMRHLARDCASEAMLVKITRIDGDWPDVTFQGELLNMPILFNPRELQLGSEVRFTPKFIHSV
jgi:hypothetical protein